MNPEVNSIPTVALDTVREFGVQVVRYSKISSDHFVKRPHRDEDFLFVYVNKGYLHLLVDFKEVIISETSIYYILPGQIHQHIDSDNDVFVIAIDTALVDDYFKMVLQQSCYLQPAIKISSIKADKMVILITLLAEEAERTPEKKYQEHIKRGLIAAVVGKFVEEYVEINSFKGANLSRATNITTEFRRLLFENYLKIKKPSQYAGKLNISTPYLNELVKEVSGKTVSYWIQHMILIEVKRLLFYTDREVKEIAYDLGFNDPAYFSRIFKKRLEITPQEFRRKYR